MYVYMYYVLKQDEICFKIFFMTFQFGTNEARGFKSLPGLKEFIDWNDEFKSNDFIERGKAKFELMVRIIF
jgi:hypothetical protein